MNILFLSVCTFLLLPGLAIAQDLTESIGKFSEIQEPKVEECSEDDQGADHCVDFHKAICNFDMDSNLAYTDRKLNYVNVLLSELAGKDFKMDSLKDNLNEDMFNETLSADPKKIHASFQKAEDEMLKSLGVSLGELSKEFEKLRVESINAINASPYPQEVKKKAAGYLKSIKLYSFSETMPKIKKIFKDNGIKGDEAEGASLLAYISTCGFGEPNAFTQSKYGFVHICPGMLNRLMSQPPGTKESLFASLSFILGHELGHSVGIAMDELEDSKKNFEKPGFTQACANVRLNLNLPGYQGLWDNLGDKAPDTLRGYLYYNESEIISDFIGSKILESHIKSADKESQERLAKAALSFFCEDEKDDSSDYLLRPDHPKSIFRLELLSKEPEFRKVLNCPPPKAGDATCGIGGVRN